MNKSSFGVKCRDIFRSARLIELKQMGTKIIDETSCEKKKHARKKFHTEMEIIIKTEKERKKNRKEKKERKKERKDYTNDFISTNKHITIRLCKK